MSQTDNAREWTAIQADVKMLARLLAPACQRIHIAGSARRGKSTVGDVELVAIPHTFAEKNALWYWLDEAVNAGIIEKALITDKNGKQSTKWGDLFRALTYKGIKFDLFLATPDTWGYIYWLRTGPADGNEYVVRRLNSHNAPFKLRKGAVWVDDIQIPVRDEAAMFELLGIPYLAPSERTKAKYQMRMTAEKHTWGDPLALVARIQAEEAANSIIWDERYIHPATGMVWVREQKTYFIEWMDTTVKWTEVFFVLRDRTHRDAQWQAKFLAGLKHLPLREGYAREMQRWLESNIALADCSTLDGVPFHFFEGGTEVRTVGIDLLTPTQSQVSSKIVAEYMASGKMRDVNGLLPCVIQFADDPALYLINGHHRWMAQRRLGETVMAVDYIACPQTLAQARGIIEQDEDADEDFLADVLQEALAILNEAGAYV